MKFTLVFFVLILSGCCATRYELASPDIPPIQLKINYQNSGLSKNDTSFAITTYFENNSNVSKDKMSYFIQSDSVRIFYILDITNTKKIVFESTISPFKDSLIEISHSNKEVRIGNKRCGYTNTYISNIQTRYKDQIQRSGESSTLEINVTK